MKIVNAEEEYVHAIRDVYARHAIHGTGNFEIDPPDAYEMFTRLEKVRSLGLSWVVALQEGKVTGYCYLTHYREYYTYRYTLEGSVYIDPTTQRQETGKALLHHVIGWTKVQGYRQLIAIVGDSNNQGSLKVYQQAGFTRIGTLKSIGFRHRSWLNTVLLQRNLGEGNSTLPPDSGVAI